LHAYFNVSTENSVAHVINFELLNTAQQRYRYKSSEGSSYCKFTLIVNEVKISLPFYINCKARNKTLQVYTCLI